MPATPTSVFDLIYSFITSEKFIAAFIGMVSGTIATFAAPWTKWHFKEKELKREARIEKIKFWRSEIDQHEDFATFVRTLTFNELRPYFTKEEQKSWDAHWYGVYLGKEKRDDRLKALKFHEVVSKIEKEWKLI